MIYPTDSKLYVENGRLMLRWTGTQIPDAIVAPGASGGRGGSGGSGGGGGGGGAGGFGTVTCGGTFDITGHLEELIKKALNENPQRLEVKVGGGGGP